MEAVETRRFILEQDKFLSEERCNQHIQFAEDTGFEEALIQDRNKGQVMNKGVRDNDRVVIDLPELAEEMYSMVKDLVPQQIVGKDGKVWKPLGLNERFRYYRYQGGQQFKVHPDGHFKRTDDEVSMVTMLVYLNEGFEGGDTEFVMPWKKVEPTTGKLLLFRHNQLHKGNPVPEGTKYVLRTDVMYKRQN